MGSAKGDAKVNGEWDGVVCSAYAMGGVEMGLCVVLFMIFDNALCVDKARLV